MLIKALQQIPTAVREAKALWMYVIPDPAAVLLPAIKPMRSSTATGMQRLNTKTSGDLKNSFCSILYKVKNLFITLPPSHVPQISILEIVIRRRGDYFADSAFCYFAAPFYKADSVAEVFRLLHVVGGEEDGHAF